MDKDRITIQKHIEYAERLREAGLIGEALANFEGLRVNVVTHCNNLCLEDIVGHIVVCLKHFYEKTSETQYLNRMRTEILFGLALQIPEGKKAVFYLRQGDWYNYMGELVQAKGSYLHAYQLVCNGINPKYMEGEYLGHYAESVSNNGGSAESIGLFFQAIKLVKQDKTTRPFHKHIILSGIYARMVLPCLKARHVLSAGLCLLKALLLSVWLYMWHKNPLRLRQLRNALVSKLLRRK